MRIPEACPLKSKEVKKTDKCQGESKMKEKRKIREVWMQNRIQ